MKNKLAELRNHREISQEGLGKILQVSRQTIISIEKGKYNPSLILAFKIAQVFNCKIEDIFIYEEE
ncbi:MAG: helix-turn-helix transcriptional regulator [Anaeromicrobium sp.]|uniref:helix-turn-helix transcriptional regulator n=1 Tax=Anaeromicrobium sp. TaxID=1929132 RepID=UPI0025FAA184|nr:helix-turn-helix transcriptional regulator [Anaeromicrobium sp.]MCT4593457.1 helix-turn-helix transcriptional regulator [Anaeromicrobium sp.]